MAHKLRRRTQVAQAESKTVHSIEQTLVYHYFCTLHKHRL